MRPLIPVSVTAVLTLMALSDCAATGAGATPLENFDPSQVRMLPDNPYPPLRASEATPRRKS
jgi:hypothetical protein